MFVLGSQQFWSYHFRVPQFCLLFWLGGVPVLLACPQVVSFWPS